MADYDFLFFGAGDASFYEQITMFIDFEAELSDDALFDIDQTIPVPFQDDVEWHGGRLVAKAEWAQTSVAEVFPDPHQTDSLTRAQLSRFMADTERWLHDVHAIAPIRAAYRTVDPTSGGTEFSEWHHWSLDRLDPWLDAFTSDEASFESDEASYAIYRTVVDQIVAFEIDRGRKISDTIRKHRNLGSILTDTIYKRDVEALKVRFVDLTPEDLEYIFYHTPGGLNESVFVVADRFLDRDDVPQNFWDGIGRATFGSFGLDDERGKRATAVWHALEGKTEKHHPAPFRRAIKTGRVEDLERAFELVPVLTQDLFDIGTSLDRSSPPNLPFISMLAKRLLGDERNIGSMFRYLSEIVCDQWTFERREPLLDEVIETLRAESVWQNTVELDRLGAEAYSAMTSGKFAFSLCAFYIICPNLDVHTSSHCNALYAVQVDNNHQAHQPEIARKLLDDCLKCASENLDIYYNAIAVWMELGEIDRAFETLQTLVKRSVSFDYDLDKVEKEPFFESLHDDPRWAEVWG